MRARVDAEAMELFRANLKHAAHATQKDLTPFGPRDFGKLIGAAIVDVVVCGPR